MLTKSWLLAIAGMWLVLAVVVIDCLLVGRARGPWNYYWLFAVGCVAILRIYWKLAARGTKPASVSRLHGFGFAASFCLYSLPLGPLPFLGLRIIPRFLAVKIFGAFLCAFGVGVAIWSRRILDKSWSPVVALADHHTLIRAGPYSIIRHPIYFGFIAASIGMICALGEIRALVLLNDIRIFFQRMTSEEKILREAYPQEYPEYERAVKRLLPCIW